MSSSEMRGPFDSPEEAERRLLLTREELDFLRAIEAVMLRYQFINDPEHSIIIRLFSARLNEITGFTEQALSAYFVGPAKEFLDRSIIDEVREDQARERFFTITDFFGVDRDKASEFINMRMASNRKTQEDLRKEGEPDLRLGK